MDESSDQLSVCGPHNNKRKLILNLGGLSQPVSEVAGNPAHKLHLPGTESPI